MRNKQIHGTKRHRRRLQARGLDEEAREEADKTRSRLLRQRANILRLMRGS